MKRKTKHRLGKLAGLLLMLTLVTGLAFAQQPSPSPKKSDDTPTTSVEAGEDAGDYTITSSIEVGYRGLSVDGDLNKYKSDLNYKAGPRLFDSTFMAKSKNGDGGVFDTFLITSTGWGADPQGNVRLTMEKPMSDLLSL